MAGDYDILAPFYNRLGMADFAAAITPVIINFAQQNDWIGRSIVDLGCGTGTTAEWLIRQSYTVISVDNQTRMISTAREQLIDTSLTVSWQNQDIRALQLDYGDLDMGLALGVMNELDSLRDIEAAFKSVMGYLRPDGWLIFDMYTIAGLTELSRQNARLLLDDHEHLTVFTSNDYDYDRQLFTRRFIILERSGELWKRQDVKLVLRAFPIQGIASLLQRSGYRILYLLTSNFERFELGAGDVQRVLFFAQRV